MNHRITALKLQKHNPQRVNVYLDGEYAFGLTRIVAAWLQVGQEITEEKATQLQAEDAGEAAYQRALKFINYRPRTENEIRRKLAKQSLSNEATELIIERLKRSGLINDADFAQGWVESRVANHPKSKRALKYELIQRGIDEQIITQNLDQIDDEEMAYRTAIKHARRVDEKEWKVFHQNMVRYLSQRGFSYEICAQVTSRVWEHLHTTDQSEDQEAPL